ncbi:MAG: hypothetical protein IJ037_14790 [Clostridia bacterium]|nr:hypothetical protein [Clostridia bacterium]
MPKLIHITDLYHPHADPDDHFDLAQIFALAKKGDIELCQVIIDWPAFDFHGDPALAAVAQMNLLSGRNVPVTVGADIGRLRGRPELWKNASPEDVKAADRILEILRNSDEKVYITIVGGCLDTAIALARDPDAFREKCAGIVLNAGSGTNTENLEWNVNLGRVEYSAIFSAPCPIYWNPCFDNIETGQGRYKTYWKFPMKRVFSEASSRLNAYFIYMLTKNPDGKYLRVLDQAVDETVLTEWGEADRNMWCTGSIFGIAGLTVSMDGEIHPADACADPVYSYEPIRVTCDGNGVTTWESLEGTGCTDDTAAPRYIFRINDEERYAEAMTKALAEILKQL